MADQIAAAAAGLSDEQLRSLIESLEALYVQRTGAPRRLIGAALLGDALGCTERHARRLLSGEAPGLAARVIVDGPKPVAAILEEDASRYVPASERGRPRGPSAGAVRRKVKGPRSRNRAGLEPGPPAPPQNGRAPRS